MNSLTAYPELSIFCQNNNLHFVPKSVKSYTHSLTDCTIRLHDFYPTTMSKNESKVPPPKK